MRRILMVAGLIALCAFGMSFSPAADEPGKGVTVTEVKFDDLDKAVAAGGKGKVVLVDFWAVWCGPCVATFPHLRDWNKDFKDKGLEIVGVTSYYELYGFDKEAGKLKRLKADEKLTIAQEHDMLKEFAAHHKLEHRLMTLNKDDIKKVYTDYKVRGIPEVVLIDRKGNVRMVKVGSGEENAKELEKMIKELLAE